MNNTPTPPDLSTMPGVEPGPHPDEEAPADLRVMARSLRQTYVALRQERFTEAQAVAILGTMLGTIGKGTGQ